MENYCAFSRDHKCILWLDYEITYIYHLLNFHTAEALLQNPARKYKSPSFYSTPKAL